MTALFISILNMSISASIVALVVMIVRIPMKKVPKIFSYALWFVVLFRLICPFSFESSFSFMPTSINVIPQDIIYVDTPINTAISNNLQLSGSEKNINLIHIGLEIAGYVWFFVFIALLLYAVIGYARFKRHVYYATLVRDNIYETDKIKTPFVLGFIRPRIYIPIGIDQVEQDYILKHEQTHIKRYDYFIKPFAFIIFTLHWFNPIMWVAYFLMSKDIEMSCDEAVLRKADEDIRYVYSSSLLNLSVKKVSLLTPLAFGESDVKDRVKNVLRFKKPSRVIIVVAVILVTILSVGFAMNKVSKAKKESSTGVSITIKNVTSSGISYYFENSSDNEYTYGEDFILYMRGANDTWNTVEPIVENWGFNAIGYSLEPRSKTNEITIDWGWLLGELPKGEYKFQKGILFIRQPGDFDRYMIECEFTLP